MWLSLWHSLYAHMFAMRISCKQQQLSIDVEYMHLHSGVATLLFFVGRSSNHVKQSWGDAVQLFVLYDPVVIHRSVFFRWPCVLYVGMLQYIYVAILMLEKLTISIVMDGWLVFVLWNIQTAVWSSDNGNDPRCWTKVMSYRRNKFEQSQRAKFIIQAIDRIFILKQ